jgi:DNA polymerase I
MRHDRSASATRGLTGETEVITTDGLARVATLAPGTDVYTLDLDTGLATTTAIRSVERRVVDTLVAIETRRADLRVAANHPIPFTTRDISRPRLVRAGAVDGRAAYLFVNDWRRPPLPEPAQVDITDWLHDDEYELCATFEAHGHTVRAALPAGCDPIRRNGTVGYCFDPPTFKRYQATIERLADYVAIHAGPNHHRRPYRFAADDFLRLLGWYITEGSVYWPETSHTAQVTIAQETPSHRRAIASLFDRLGITVQQNDQRFAFGSVVFGRLLERLCGGTSHTKQLPPFIWEWSQASQRLLLDVLLKGDGDARGTYYTASTRLAHDLLRLCVECGVKPRYTRRGDMWRVYVRNVNDGFRPEQHVRRFHRPWTVYDLTLEDGAVVMAGRNGRLQWVGTGGAW